MGKMTMRLVFIALFIIAYASAANYSYASPIGAEKSAWRTADITSPLAVNRATVTTMSNAD